MKPFKNQLKPLTNPVKRRITQEKFHLNFENADRFPSRMTSRSTHYQEPTVKTAINLDIFVYIPLKRVRPYCPRFEAPSDPTCCRRKKNSKRETNDGMESDWEFLESVAPDDARRRLLPASAAAVGRAGRAGAERSGPRAGARGREPAAPAGRPRRFPVPRRHRGRQNGRRRTHRRRPLRRLRQNHRKPLYVCSFFPHQLPYYKFLKLTFFRSTNQSCSFFNYSACPS